MVVARGAVRSFLKFKVIIGHSRGTQRGELFFLHNVLLMGNFYTIASWQCVTFTKDLVRRLSDSLCETGLKCDAILQVRLLLFPRFDADMITGIILTRYVIKTKSAWNWHWCDGGIMYACLPSSLFTPVHSLWGCNRAAYHAIFQTPCLLESRQLFNQSYTLLHIGQHDCFGWLCEHFRSQWVFM